MEAGNYDEIRKQVRENYGNVAEATTMGCGCSATGNCCSPRNGIEPAISPITLGYSSEDAGSIPDGANMGLGCGNPHAIASLQPGETVLDLGSGGGIDCFLAAKAVGKQGRVIGVDMTPEMLYKARKNAEKSGYTNVEFRLGEIENLPIADASIDIIISNCVINLSPEKAKVFAEAFRTLKPGGRLAIADIVTTNPLPERIKQDMALVTACMAGASPVSELESVLTETGFVDIRIQSKDSNNQIVQNWNPKHQLEDYVFSATIEAKKPNLVR